MVFQCKKYISIFLRAMADAGVTKSGVGCRALGRQGMAGGLEEGGVQPIASNCIAWHCRYCGYRRY